MEMYYVFSFSTFADVSEKKPIQLNEQKDRPQGFLYIHWPSLLLPPLIFRFYDHCYQKAPNDFHLHTVLTAIPSAMLELFGAIN